MLGLLFTQDFKNRYATLEPRWLGNQKERSCIPKGTYECKRFQSKKFGSTYEVTKVPERSGIIFHTGNTRFDTKGCILIGTDFEEKNGEWRVINSRAAFRSFLKVTPPEDKFTLQIADNFEEVTF